MPFSSRMLNLSTRTPRACHTSQSSLRPLAHTSLFPTTIHLALWDYSTQQHRMVVLSSSCLGKGSLSPAQRTAPAKSRASLAHKRKISSGSWKKSRGISTPCDRSRVQANIIYLRYLSPDIKVRRGDVLSSWTGIRPLVRDPAAGSSANLVRSHMLHVSDSGLLTAAGGKWTTYRSMAQDCVDKAIEVFGFPKVPCRTEKIRLLGSDGWSPSMFIGLIQRV